MNLVTGPPFKEYAWKDNDALVRDTVRFFLEEEKDWGMAQKMLDEKMSIPTGVVKQT